MLSRCVPAPNRQQRTAATAESGRYNCGYSPQNADSTKITPRSGVSLGKLFRFLKTLFTLQKDLTANISTLAWAMDQYFGESCIKLRFRGDLLRFFDKFPAEFHVERLEYDPLGCVFITAQTQSSCSNQKQEKEHDALVTWTPSETEFCQRQHLLVVQVQRFLEKYSLAGLEDVMKMLLGDAWSCGQNEVLWALMQPEEEIELVLEAVPCPPLEEVSEDNISIGYEVSEAGHTTPPALTPCAQPIQPGYVYVHDPYSLKVSPQCAEAVEVGQIKVFPVLSDSSAVSAGSEKTRVRFRMMELMISSAS